MNLRNWIAWGVGLGAALIGLEACQPVAADDDGSMDVVATGGGSTGGAGQCLASETACVDGCKNLQSSPQNCGACGMACAADQVCSQGVCGATCAAGLSACTGACVDLVSDPTNCGTCGNACASGMCQNSACVTGTGTGGAGSGGAGSGGAASGGAASGGSGATSSGGTTSNPGDDPPGFWRYNELKGCSWTGVDDTGVGTTIMPGDFTTRAPEEAFCASGTVGGHEMYESVALLGFNVNEDPATADCSYDPNAAQEMGPPGVALTGSGIAANIVKQGTEDGFTFRIQIQGPNGATDENDRWCATITETEGKIFVPYEEFNTECWDDETGTAYSGQPISAVVFLVPGSLDPVPYDFCVNGFAPGDSADDAPDGPAEIGDSQGTVGFSGSRDGDFDRVKVTVDGEQYIIQNNNWGKPDSTDLILNYFNNSFTVAEGSGTRGSSGEPASFPSIYIGANGETEGGVLATSGTDNLPKAVDQIGSIQTSFKWSGSTSSFNTTYDVWFANGEPSGIYEDALDGFVMVWAHKPGDEQPIGSIQGSKTIAGHTWDVWVGPRGGSRANSNAPVVSYVAQGGDVMQMNFDLKEFIDDSRSYGMNATHLTDVFFGFEIWNGGAGGNLSVDEFTCKVE